MHLSSFVLTGFIFLVIFAKIGYFISLAHSIYHEDKDDSLRSNV